MQRDLLVTASPHIYDPNTVKRAMLDVIIALLPAALLSVYLFGLNALLILIIAPVAAVASEIFVRRSIGRPMVYRDLSAVVAGVILALNLPAGVPWWMPAVGAFVAVAFAKELLGGIGMNMFNPALVGRAFLHVSWSIPMTTWLVPFWWKDTGFFDLATTQIRGHDVTISSLQGGELDGATGATPLALIRPAFSTGEELPGHFEMFLGNTGGSLGETSALALLLGGLYLLWRSQIDWRIPVSVIGGVAVMALLVGGNPLFHILAGGVFLGAFFMATDWVTSPVTKLGRVIFGVGIGVMTVLIRTYGGFPEGVCYAILLMNGLVPLIDQYTRPRPLGARAVTG